MTLHQLCLLEVDFLLHSLGLIPAASPPPPTTHTPHTHTCCIKYGGSKKLIYTTSLSSVFLCNKSHPPIQKQERPPVCLFYPSDTPLLQFGANCSGGVFIQLSTAYLPSIAMTYFFSFINRFSFHNPSGFHLHTKGLSPLCAAAPYHTSGSLLKLALWF